MTECSGEINNELAEVYKAVMKLQEDIKVLSDLKEK